MKIFYTCSILLSLGGLHGAEQKTQILVPAPGHNGSTQSLQTYKILETSDKAKLHSDVKTNNIKAVTLFMQQNPQKKIALLWYGIQQPATTEKMISLLIKTNKGSNLDIKDPEDNNNTALHKATFIDPYECNNTVLKAIITRKAFIIKNLIAAQCAQQKLNNKDEYPITIALSRKNNLTLVKLLYTENPYLQLRASELKLIKENDYSKLIPKPEILNYEDPRNGGKTLLHKKAAADEYNDTAPIVEKLCQIDGIDASCKDALNHTPLGIALRQPIAYTKNPLKVAQILISHDPNKTAPYLGPWAKRGFYFNEKVLPFDATQLNAKNKNGNGALHLAVMGNHENTVMTLIASGAHPFLLNNEKKRPASLEANLGLQRSIFYYQKSLGELYTMLKKSSISSTYKDIDLYKPETWPISDISILMQDAAWKKECLTCKQNRGDYIVCHDKALCSQCLEKLEKSFFGRNCPQCTKHPMNNINKYICPACRNCERFCWYCAEGKLRPYSVCFLPIACSKCKFSWQLYTGL